MRRLILAVFILSLVAPISIYSQQVNQTDLLKALLDLPAPAPFEKEEDDQNLIVDSKPTLLDSNKVPPDDAPIEQILEFWARFGYSSKTDYQYLKPTDIVAERIFDEIKKTPTLLTTYISILPPKKEFVEYVKDFYDENLAKLEKVKQIDYEEAVKPKKSVSEAIAAADEELAQTSGKSSLEDQIYPYILERIKEWLTLNSKYFSEELVTKANKIKDRDNYVKNREVLVALAKVDWEKAEPILERLLDDKSQPASATLATWAYYAHFLHEEDERSAQKYRRLLQDIVEDRKAAAGVRDLALDGIVTEGDFEGRDDWYVSLLGDETLFNLGNYTGLKSFMDAVPPEKWIGKMLELVGHNSPTVHKAAIRNLTILLGKAGDEQDKLILKALLPWLSNPTWANTDQGREKLIAAYGRIRIPESVAALILIIQNETPEAEEVFLQDSNRSIDAMKKMAGDKMQEAVDKMRDASNANMTTSDYDEKAVEVKRLTDTQSQAIDALATYKDSRAIPVLQSVLSEVTVPYQRRKVMLAIILSGGYDANQQLNGVEAISRRISESDLITSIEEVYYGAFEDEVTPTEELGQMLSQIDEPDENLVRLTIARVKSLRKSEPKVANVLNQFLQKWKSKVNDIERLNAITSNTADLETIIRALADRKKLRKNYRNQIYSMLANGGTASGIAACLLEDQNEILGVTNSGNINTKVAGYACARLLRMSLPVDAAAKLLNSSNSLLAIAADRYLTAEDSSKARSLILAKYPGEAKILGARHAFVPDQKGNYDNLPMDDLFISLKSDRYYWHFPLGDLDKAQDKLREEIKADQELLGIYAFLVDDTSGHKILRIFRDKAVYSWYEDDARFRERIVNKEELKLIFDYVSRNQIENLNPILSECHHGCPSKEFVMFGRNGGRRIYIYAGYLYEQPLYGLEMAFVALEQGESNLRYWLEDKISGLEVMLDEKNIKARSLWKDGDDFRVLVLDENRQDEIEKEIEQQAADARVPFEMEDYEDNWEEHYRRSEEINKESARQRIERKYEPYAWRSVTAKKLGEKVSQPAGDLTISERGEFPEVDSLENPLSLWKARHPQFEVRSGDYSNNGIWKVFPNGLTAQISKSDFSNSIVTSENGKWALVNKVDQKSEITEIYRLNLQTGKEFKVNLKITVSAQPIAYLKSYNKFLVYTGSFDDFDEEYNSYLIAEIKERLTKEQLKNYKPAYYLLDAETGSLKEVKGDFAPLKQIKYRNLQPTSNTDEFWVAIPDKKLKLTQIGRYNTKTFKFTEMLKIPEIKLTSMDVWVDEKGAKIYFIYEGHLLSLPLGTSVPPK